MIKKIRPDILHAHYAGTYGLVGALSGFHPYVVTAWGSDVLLTRKSFIKRPLVKYVLTKADLITCDAEHMVNTVLNWGINKEKIRIIYFGVEPDRFKPGEKDRGLVAELGLGNSFTVISLRNLESIYDVETLVRAIPLVLREIPEVKFLIAGKGTQEQFLKKLAESLSIMNVTRFVGFIPNEELPKYLRTADIYVSTSLSDAGISASTAEAMACGLPVIITDSGENRIWVENGKNGFLAPIRNPEILAEKIVYLLRNEEIRKKIGENPRKTIEERNNYYKEMEKMGKLYEKVLTLYQKSS